MIDPELNYSRHEVAALGSATEDEPVLILVSGRNTVVVQSETESSGPTGSDGEGFDGDSRSTVIDPGDTVSSPPMRFPSLKEIPPEVLSTVTQGDLPIHEIAQWDGRPVYAVGVAESELDAAAVTGFFTREDFRSLYLAISEIEQCLFSRAIQIVEWYHTTRFCSACGSPTRVPESEAVAACPECDHVQYPRVAPAMIVAVIRDGKILLARSPRFRGAFHSVLAGFVEPGESVEDCIHREVWEEVGVRVRNIRYFGSQSWPYSHSLMLGYTAEWAGGEINIDEEEIEHADWYGPEELPPVPGELSIAGRMIAKFTERSQ